MSVNNFWIPIGPTDFATPLSKVYERQKNQDKKEQENVEEHARQVEAADSGVLALKTLNNALKAGTAGIKASKAMKQRGEAKKTKKAAEMEDKMRANVITKEEGEIVKEYVKYQKGTSELHEQGIKFEDFLADKKINDRLKEQLLEASPGESLRIQEWQINNLGIHAKADFETYKAGLTKKDNAEEINKIAAYEQKNGKSYFEEWFVSKYGADYDISSEAAGALLAPEVKRASKTIEGSSSNAFNAKFLTDGAAKFSERIDSTRKTWGAAAQNGPEMSRAFQSRTSDVYLNKLAELNLPEGAEYSDDQKATARSQAQEQVSNELYALARSGKLTFAEFQGLRNGNIIGHPSGDTADIMLSSKQWAHIEAGITQASDALITSDIAAKKQNIINADAAYRRGEGSLKDVNNAQNSFISAGGDSKDSVYKRSIGYSQGHNTKEAFERTLEEWQPYITGNKRGSLTDERVIKSIDAIKNDDVRDMLQAEVKRQKALKGKVGFPPNKKALDADTFRLVKQFGLKKTLGEFDDLTGPVAHMVNEMSDKREWFLSEQDENDPNALILADQKWTAWLTKNGLFAKKPGDEGYGGRFWSGKRGDFKTYTEFLADSAKGITENRQLATLDNIKKWTSSVTKPFKKDKTLKDVLDEAGSVTDESDIYGAFANSTISLTNANGDTVKQPVYSQELLYKAHALGVQPSVLLKRQGRALLDSLDKDDPTKIQLEKWLDDFDNQPDSSVEIRDSLVKDRDLKSKDLLYGIEFIGYDNLSPKQLERLNTKLLAQVDKVDAAQTHFSPSEADGIKFYKDNNAAEAIEDFNKKYPLNNITVKDIIWNPTTKKWDLRLKDRDLIPTIQQN